MLRCTPIWVLLALPVLTGTASAQGRLFMGNGVGVGVGPSWNYYNLPGGPYTYPYYGPGYGWGYFPGAYGSFWTNGLSLYGPPVPTMGVTPGSFGGSDAHKQYFSNPPRTFSLGWHGYYSPSPRHLPFSVDPYPRAHFTGPGYDSTAPRESVPATMSSVPYASSGSLRLEVTVPTADAQVWIDGHPTKAVGTTRVYESPQLSGDQEFLYQITAKWADGQIDTKTVSGKAGQTVNVVFNGTPATAKK